MHDGLTSLNTQDGSSTYRSDHGKEHNKNNNVQRKVKDERPPIKEESQENKETLPSPVRQLKIHKLL